MISRRLFLRNTAAAGAVGVTVTVPAVAEAKPHVAAVTAWSALIASMADIAPAGSRLQVYGGTQGCRVEFLEMFSQPVHPSMPGRMMEVEWITASYRLTPSGWESEGRYESRRKGSAI